MPTILINYSKARFVCIITHVDSRAILKAFEADGWTLKRITGSHHHYTHPTKPGFNTVPHPKKDLPVGTVKAMERQSGIPLLR